MTFKKIDINNEAERNTFIDRYIRNKSDRKELKDRFPLLVIQLYNRVLTDIEIDLEKTIADYVIERMNEIRKTEEKDLIIQVVEVIRQELKPIKDDLFKMKNEIDEIKKYANPEYIRFIVKEEIKDHKQKDHK